MTENYEILEAWITTKALTEEIRRIFGKEQNNLFTEIKYGAFYGKDYKKNEYHLTEAAAKARADVMRKRKIASLERQIAKLKAMMIESLKDTLKNTPEMTR